MRKTGTCNTRRNQTEHSTAQQSKATQNKVDQGFSKELSRIRMMVRPFARPTFGRHLTDQSEKLGFNGQGFPLRNDIRFVILAVCIL